MTEPLRMMREEYKKNMSGMGDPDPDPLKQFEKWFDEAVAAGVREPNAMALATSESNGRVSSRMVLLKGIEHGRFRFFTNFISLKGRQLIANPQAALLFFWPEAERQIRVEGTTIKISRKRSVEYFNQRPLESRISAIVSPQSQPIPDRQFLEAIREGVILDLGNDEPSCPDQWGGFDLKPFLIEFWQGRPNRLHDRIQYIRSGKAWVRKVLAP